MRITAKARQNGLLAPGYHVGVIESIKETEIQSKSCKDGEYDDATPQLEVRLKTDKGSTNAWLFTKGYEKYDELTKDMSTKERAKYKPGGEKGYAVLIATNERVESETETEKALEIVANFAAAAGAKQGEEIDVADLVGSEVGFVIGEGNNGGNRVKFFCEPSYALSQMDKEDGNGAETEI